jgi:hypothetical protein
LTLDTSDRDIHVERHFCEPLSDAAVDHLPALNILIDIIVANASQLNSKAMNSKVAVS